MHKMHKLILALLALGFSTSPMAAEQETAAPEERIRHYEAAAPKDRAEALLVIEDSLKIIEADLAARKLEAVHEQSYHLEAAVEALRKDAKDKKHTAAVDALDEAVQIVHYASENGKGDEVHAALPVLRAAAEKIAGILKE